MMVSAYSWEISTSEQVKDGENQQRAAGEWSPRCFKWHNKRKKYKIK